MKKIRIVKDTEKGFVRLNAALESARVIYPELTYNDAKKACRKRLIFSVKQSGALRSPYLVRPQDLMTYAQKLKKRFYSVD